MILSVARSISVFSFNGATASTGSVASIVLYVNEFVIQLCLPDLFKIRKAILFDQNIVFQSIQKLTLIPLILEMVMTAPKKFGLAALCACIAVVAVFTAICFGIAAKRTSQLFNANLHRVEISVCLHSFPVHLL